MTLIEHYYLECESLGIEVPQGATIMSIFDLVVAKCRQLKEAELLVIEFLDKVENEPLASCAAPGYYMNLFIQMLDEFRDEKCSVLLGKIKGNMSKDLKDQVSLQ